MDEIEMLKTIEGIRYLEARYARYADEKRWADLASLFLDEGTFASLDVEGNVLIEMVGRDDIAAKLAAANAGDVTPLHQLLTSEIDVLSPTTAKAIWAMADIVIRGDDAIPEPGAAGDVPPFRTMRGYGHYHVTYAKIDGAWYIATRRQTRTRLEFTF
ncbi:MAG: nuclear transport factor 2 family protein [Hyphomicrobiales bacterium]|nr:MAG: nuclear transport factor 2 family protein [Hyphomicrobiales bacterium]